MAITDQYFIQNRLVVDEVGYRFWMRLNADCGEVGCGLWRLALGGSRLAARRGFYSHDPELGGSPWIELQNGSKDR